MERSSEQFRNSREKRSPHDLERFRTIADLFEQTHELIERLNEMRPPDASEHYFTFYNQGLDPAVLPETVKELSRTFDHPVSEIQIDIGKDLPETTSSVTLRFLLDLDEEDKTVILSSRQPNYTVAELDDVVVSANDPDLEKEFSVPKISDAEMSRCLASLCFPSTTGDYSQFEQFELTNGVNYDILIDLLQKHAQYYSSEIIYELPSEDATMEGCMSYTDDNGEIVYARLQQLVHSDIFISETGDLTFDEAAMITEIQTLDSVSVQFSSSSSIHGDKKIAPKQTDYTNVDMFIRHHTDKMPKTPTTSLDEFKIDDLPQADD